MKCVRFFAMLLMVIGSLNWGLVGFFGYNLVADLFGGISSAAARAIFALVGLAGLYGVGFLFSCCGSKSKDSCSKSCDSDCKCGCHKKDQK